MKFWVHLSLALILGMMIGWIDSQPTWDDTGMTVGLILIVSIFLGMANPSRAWLFGLVSGGGVSLVSVMVKMNTDALAAMVIAVVGAYIGAGLRKVANATASAGNKEEE